ncbi:hypothetical protein Tco_1264499 [Tanacetum coccineum]
MVWQRSYGGPVVVWRWFTMVHRHWPPLIGCFGGSFGDGPSTAVRDELEVWRLVRLVRRLARLARRLAQLPEQANDSSRSLPVTLRLEDRECDSLSPAYQSEERDLMSIIGI